MIDFLATLPHYADHLLSIWEALTATERGQFHCGPRARPILRAHGVVPAGEVVGRSKGPVAVASYNDLKRVRGRPAVLLEHGAGQHYGGEHTGSGAYSGGSGRDGVALFLVPNTEAARRNAEVYPLARIEVVGCPKLDRWHRVGWQSSSVPGASGEPTADGDDPTRHAKEAEGAGQLTPGRPLPRLTGCDNPENNIPANVTPLVCVSFHWDCRVIPEARWAFPHFSAALPELARRYHVIGHGHPRAFATLKRRYRAMGITSEPSFEEVLERADVYVCDNSSTLYEFASTGRPVVVMDAPWYRRDVEHGLRFWKYADVGVRTGDPSRLADAVQRALADPDPVRENRERAVAAAYTHTDGRATERAVRAIRETFWP